LTYSHTYLRRPRSTFLPTLPSSCSRFFCHSPLPMTDTGGRSCLSPQLLSELRSPPGRWPELLQELRHRSSAAGSTSAARVTTTNNGNTGPRTERNRLPDSRRLARGRASFQRSSLSISDSAYPIACRCLPHHPGRRACRLCRRLDRPVFPNLRRAEMAGVPSLGEFHLGFAAQ